MNFGKENVGRLISKCTHSKTQNVDVEMMCVCVCVSRPMYWWCRHLNFKISSSISMQTRFFFFFAITRKDIWTCKHRFDFSQFFFDFIFPRFLLSTSRRRRCRPSPSSIWVIREKLTAIRNWTTFALELEIYLYIMMMCDRRHSAWPHSLVLNQQYRSW